MRTPRRRNRGTTLVEALIAFLVLSFGTVALIGLQADLRAGSQTARQRSEAVRLAEEDLEHLRGFATVAASGVVPSYADVASATRSVAASAVSPGSPRYTLVRQVQAAGVASAREVTISVDWQDARGTAQRVVLASVIAATDPALGGALGLAPTGAPPAP